MLILTLRGLTNYGNRLQNYALSRSVENIAGGRVRTIDFIDLEHLSALDRLKKLAKSTTGFFDKKRADIAKRESLFRSFDEEYIPSLRFEYKNAMYLREGIIVGSDQVWNPNWDIGSRKDGLAYLQAIQPKFKLSYAASFGIRLEDISEEYKIIIEKGLKTFEPSLLSVREEEGARIVEKITGKCPAVVLDPTMLLDPEEWVAIEQEPEIEGLKGIKERYCLQFMLGDASDEGEVNKIAAQANMPLLNFGNRKLPVGPREFVWAINHAGAVCTDSFHAAAFSIMLGKPVFIFERKQCGQCNMSSRFETLSSVFNLESNFVHSSKFDFDAVVSRDKTQDIRTLAKKRDSSKKWLRDAVNVVKDR